MKLQRYLDRIGFAETARPDLDTLRRLHHQHLLHVTYENLSVQLGEPLGLEIEPIYDKIVERGRGGWCYEMNGLLHWALEEIGFDVTRMAAGVFRSERGESAVGNHLVLAVHLDGEPWLADVGLGDGMREPIPLREGSVEQHGLTYRLHRLDDGYWRFTNHARSTTRDFDFRFERADESLLAAQCERLRTSPESSFVLNLVCQRFEAEAIQTLRGRVRRRASAEGVDEWLLGSAEELEREVRTVFGLDVGVAELWPRVEARHRVVFG